jgi:hypothetical protein
MTRLRMRMKMDDDREGLSALATPFFLYFVSRFKTERWDEVCVFSVR